MPALRPGPRVPAGAPGPRRRTGAWPRAARQALGLAWPLAWALTQVAQAAAFLPGALPDPATGEAPPEADGNRRANAGGPASPASEPLRAPGVQWRLAPWQLGGSASLTGRWLRQPEASSRQTLVLTDLEWRSHVWQPWFIQLRAGLGLLAAHDQSQAGADDHGSASTGLTSTGRLAVAVFPASRFPFELRADVGDSRSSGDSVGGDVRTQRVSLSQGWRPEFGNTALNLRLDHSRLQAARARDTLTTLQASARDQWGQHTLELGTQFSVNQLADDGGNARQLSLNANHGWQPSAELQVQTQANWHTQRLRTPAPPAADGGSATGSGLSVESTLRQISTVAQWRPAEDSWLYREDLPLQGAASLRWVDARSASAGTPDGTGLQAQAVSATVGGSAELTRAWRLGASLAASRVQARGQPAADTLGANAALNWSPSGQAWGSWRYVPSLGANAGLTRGGGARRVLLGLQGTQSLNRDWPLAEGQTLALNLAQSAGLLHETGAARATQALAHTLSLYWQASDARGGQRHAGLSLSDSISRSATRGRFQLLNLQLDQRMPLSRHSGWSANLTWQATRNRATTVDVFTGAPVRSAGGWQHFASGGLSLEHQRLLGVPRLRHTLRLTLDSQQFERRSAGDIDAPRERITRSLESRLDHTIGRLELRLSLRAATVDGRDVVSLLAQAQRRF